MNIKILKRSDVKITFACFDVRETCRAIYSLNVYEKFTLETKNRRVYFPWLLLENISGNHNSSNSLVALPSPVPTTV